MVPQQRWIWLIYFIFLWIVQIASKEVRVVCYYTNWSVYRPGSAKFSPQNINPYLCTHLIYAFGGFTKENTLKPFDKYQDIEKGGYAKFTGLKTYNKNLKTMLAIGGWNEGSSRFSPMVANAERRKELVKNVVKFLRQNHFDGLDLDWEYPSFRDGGKTRDRDNYAQLVQELREEFERESGKTRRTRLLLTMAVPAGIEYINKGYDVPKLMKYLDWMNILSYDYHSAFEPSVNHHAPLYPLEEDNEYNYDTDLNIDHTIKHYLEAGAISEKLVLGIPTYGRSYTLFNPDANEIGAPADGPGEMGDATRENGYLAYYEICESVKNGEWEVVQPNENAMGPYAFKDNQWVGYDDENIARKKSQYVAEHNLGGIMFWAIDNDDFRGTCHNKSYPIIEAAKEALVEALGLTDENVISKPTKATKTRGRPRTTAKTTETPVLKERTQNSGGRQSSDKPSSRRRIVNRVRGNSKNAVQSTNVHKSKRRRRPTTKSTPIRDEPSFKESGSSLVMTTPSYKTPEPPTTPDPGGDFKCEDEGFYPHPRDCKKYFWCLSGPSELGIIAHQFTCPAGLYFNKAAASCDYTQNVLCNKKRNTTPKPTTTVSTTEVPKPETTKKVEIFNFSTKRPSPKITAATSRTTFYSTTEAPEYYDEYEYEDDVEDEDEDDGPDNNDSEDPLVIKELLELIKKAGGIEELEKQLHLKSDSTQGEGSTTQSSLSKKLYERVLAKTKLSDSLNARKNSVKYNSINRNSRGPQSGGTTGEGESKVEKTRTRGSRPEYSTISRQRASKVKDIKDDEDEEDEEEEEIDDVKENKEVTQGGKKYITLRRNRPTTSATSTAESDIEDSLTKLGESRGTTSTSRSPYVTLKRSRPTTTATEESTATDAKTIRRRPNVETNDEVDSSSPNYVVIQRSRPTTTTTEGSTAKYREIVRGTTAIPGVSEDIEKETETLDKVSSVQSSTSDTNSITNASDDITNPIVTNINEDTTARVSSSQNTEKQSGDLSTTQKIEIKPPKLSEPRPFSFNTNVKSTTTEKVTPSTKVSYKPLLRSRPVEAPDSNQHLDVNNNDQNNKVDTVYTRTRSRGSSRFRVPETTTERIYSQTGGGGGSYEEYERHYRPDLSAHISDLSSLTAVDFSLKDITGSSRRLRPRIIPAATKTTASTSSATTTTTEKIEETGSRTSPLTRKFVDSSSFGSRRRSTTISTTPISTSGSSQPTRRPFAPIRKGFTTISPKSTTENDSQKIKRPIDSSEIKTEASGPIIKFKRPVIGKQSSEGNGSALKFRRPTLPKTTTNVTTEESGLSEKITRPVFNRKIENKEDEIESKSTTRRIITSTTVDIKSEQEEESRSTTTSTNSVDEDNLLAKAEDQILNTTSEIPLLEITTPLIDSEDKDDKELKITNSLSSVDDDTKAELKSQQEDDSISKSTISPQPESDENTDDIKEDSDDTSNETDSKVKIRRPTTEETGVTKLNRKVIKRIRVTTPRATTIHEDSSSQIVVPVVNPELNNIRQTPIPYARKVGPVTENTAENVVNSTEDDAEDELDEDENIKLSESNILENSDLNRVNTNAINDGGKKGHRKVIKRIKFTTQSSDITSSTEEIEPKSSTESGVLRTRKVIRKLGSGSTEASNTEDNKRKKIIRRLRPKTPTALESSEESEEQEEYTKEIISQPKFTTTTESLKNRIKPFRPNKKLPIKEPSEKLLNKQLPSRLKLFARRPPTTTERVVTSTVDPLSIADIIKFNASNETSEDILNEKRLEIYTRSSTEKTLNENGTEYGSAENQTEISTNEEKLRRLQIYTRYSTTEDNLSEDNSDESLTDIVDDSNQNTTDSTLLAKRLKAYTRPPPSSTDELSSDNDESSTDQSLSKNKLRIYTNSTSEVSSIGKDEEVIMKPNQGNINLDNINSNKTEEALLAKRLKLYTRPPSTENVSIENVGITTNSDDITENPLSKRLNSTQTNDENKKSDIYDSNITEESLSAKRLKLYTRPPTTEKVYIENNTHETTDSAKINNDYETEIENSNVTEGSQLKSYTTLPTNEQESTESITTKSDDITEDPLLAKRLKLYTRTTTQKPSTEAIIDEIVSTESNTEENTEPSTEEIVETTIIDDSDTTEEVTTEIPDEITTEYDSTETTEITTLEPKPSTPVYVNKIYKTAGARPKLDLKSRLGLKYTTASSVRSTTKSSTRFEARSRRPHRFRSSTTEANRIEEPDIDDVGYGTVKPFKKLFVSTDRPRFKINNDGIRENYDDEEDEDDDYEEYEEEKEIKPVISSTTGKYYVNTDSFNRSQYSKPTESVEILNDELEDDDEEDEDEDEDFPDSDGEDEDERFETISRRPYVITSRKPFSTSTDKVSFVTSNTPARTRKVNNPYESTSKRIKTSTRAYRRFTSTTPLTTTQNLTDINIEALNQRNKQLFNKTRKMNTPYPGPVSMESNITVSTIDINVEANTTVATETTTDTAMYSTDANIIETTMIEDNVVNTETENSNDLETTTINIEPPTVPPTIRTTTTDKPTTFYHIFAETESTQSTPTLEETTTETKKEKDTHMVEKIIEVNRIVHINGENNTQEMNPVLDHIGVVNRVTVIKVVEGNNSTNNTNPEQKVAISINGPNILTEIIGTGLREERKFEIYGDSKVSNSLNQQYSDIINAKNSESVPNIIVIDSKSVVKTITPKPLFSNEVSTIALEGLFMTQSTSNPEQPSTTEYEELLETENSHFVNVKVLHGSPKNAVFIVKPEEDVTMKADVVEISRPITAGLIKIAPISVSFQKKIPNIK